LLPQKKPPQPNYLRSWVDTARKRPAFKTFQNRIANSDGRNIEAESPNAFLTQNPQTIQNILRSVFANAAKVMIAFNSAEDGFLKVFDLIQGFKKLGVHQFSILQALKDIKFYMKDQRISALHFRKNQRTAFHWGVICSDNELVALWLSGRNRVKEIRSKFLTAAQNLAAKEAIALKYKKVLCIEPGILRQNKTILQNAFNKVQSSFYIRNPVKALKRQINGMNLGPKYKPLEIALAILSELAAGDASFEDVDSMLKQLNDIDLCIQHKFSFQNVASIEDFSHSMAKDNLHLFPQTTYKSPEIKIRRPLSALEAPKDRLVWDQRPRTARMLSSKRARGL
jgi:hypothetical protein